LITLIIADPFQAECRLIRAIARDNAQFEQVRGQCDETRARFDIHLEALRGRKTNNKEDRFTGRHKARGLICHACKLIHLQLRKFRGRIAETVNRTARARTHARTHACTHSEEFLEHMLNVLRNISPTGWISPSPPGANTRGLVSYLAPSRRNRGGVEDTARVYLKNDLT